MKNYRNYFTRAIQATYPDDAADIIRATDLAYKEISADTSFALTSKNPIDRRLDFSAYFLALIKTLHQKGESFDTIRTLSLQVVTAYVQPRNDVQRWAKRQLPRLLPTWLGQRLLKVFREKVSVNEHPDGFVAHLITDKNETYGLGYGIDIMACGICTLFKKHDYLSYVPILCEVDKITSEMAGLTLIRTGTLAGGAAKCDFRFQRKAATA